MKKTLWTLISTLVLLSMLVSACAPTATVAPMEAPTTAPATEAPAATKAPAEAAAPTATSAPAASAAPVTIKIFAPGDPEHDMATNTFSLQAEKMFNIKFEWQLTPFDGAAAKEKRQLALASGDYPDLFMLIPWIDQFTPLDLLKYGQQGVVIPLNDLIDQYAPNVKAAIEKYPDYKAMTIAPDGKIYGLPQLIECYHCLALYKYWMNTKWTKGLNMKTPTTTEEFKQLLEAYKTKDPNGNGTADEVPLSGTVDWSAHVVPYLMDGYVYDDDNTFLMLNNGKVEFAANKQEWKDGLAYIKSMYDEGLIDPGAFTQNHEALQRIGNNADAEILGGCSALHPNICLQTGDNAPYGADFDTIPPLKGPNHDYATYIYSATPGATFVLTNKASKEAQIAAIKLVDYMFTTEGQLRSHFGEEGVDWRRPQSGDVAINKNVQPIFATIPLPSGAKPTNTHWGAMAQYFQPITFRDGWVQSTDIYSSNGYERRLQEATDTYLPKAPKDVMFPYWGLWPDPTIADSLAMTKQNIVDYVNQNSLAFITGQKNLDSDWDAYVKGLDGLDLKGYIDANQKAYDASAYAKK
jgi:putative aldouronate transport system substrate-binding protein